MDKLRSFGELALGSRLKRLSDSLMKDVKKIYKSLYIDFEPTYMPVFKTIYEEQKITIGKTADLLNISQPAVTQFANALEKKKLIISSSDKIDKRKKIISLSKKGKETVQKLQPIWEVIDSEMKNLTHFDSLIFTEQIENIENELKERTFYNRVHDSLKTKVTIIPYSDRYAQIFHDLNMEWLEKYFYVEDHDKEVLENPRSYIIDNNGFIFFAKYNDKVVATVALMNEPGGYELSKMAVLPKYQGLKIGQKLMDYCIQFSIKKNWPALLIYSNTKLSPAINMYRKNGFIEIPIEKNNPYNRGNIKMKLTFDSNQKVIH
jgi:DNA-binding MarR family transcriptional regulator/N-acetylglutamate synthase-like GNAT family acetyltransferase